MSTIGRSNLQYCCLCFHYCLCLAAAAAAAAAARNARISWPHANVAALCGGQRSQRNATHQQWTKKSTAAAVLLQFAPPNEEL